MCGHRRDRIDINSATIPRTSIESVHHASIDALLKELKTILRRVKAFSTPFSEELQVLERLYYKGKNQHRPAKFWRKLAEVRRQGARIREMNSQSLVENFQHAFYVQDNDRASLNPPRGAWKQTPDSNACVSVLKWLRSAWLLIDQTRARFRLAYGAFTMQIRTASFIPLATSLLSITARLNFLLAELHEILGLQWQVTARLLQVLATPNSDRYHNALLSTNPFDMSPVNTAREVTRRVTPEITEDLGDKVTRSSYDPLTSSGGADLPVVTFQHFDYPIPYPNVENEARDAEIAISKETPPIVIPLVEMSMESESQRSELDEGDGRKEIKQSISDNDRDEIDDIFGF